MGDFRRTRQLGKGRQSESRNDQHEGGLLLEERHALQRQRRCPGVLRFVQGTDYPFFYNPMWGLFGDGREGPAGSYYYAKSGHETYFWNIFDQAARVETHLLCHLDRFV